MKRGIFYIDGLNLENTLRKAFPKQRWLDVRALLALRFPDIEPVKIWYFSSPFKGNIERTREQRIYWDALESDPTVEIVEGRHEKQKKKAPEHLPQACCAIHKTSPGSSCCGRQHMVEFRQLVEKQSDVNLATRLLVDALALPVLDALGEPRPFDVAVVVSRDSDLKGAIYSARTVGQVEMAVLNVGRQIKEMAEASDHNLICAATPELQACQFPTTLRGRRGQVVVMPNGWNTLPDLSAWAERASWPVVAARAY